MKYLILLLLVVATLGCSKNNKISNGCVYVTVTKIGTPCSQWGIKVNDNVYPSNNIPSQFQQEGLSVCADYALCDDLRLCACCGGTWADIRSMRIFIR